MKKSVLRVALSFATYTNDQLNSFVILVLACLKNNPLFPNLPVKYDDLAALLAAYQAALAAAAVGGTKDTAALNEARNALVSALRQICGYIQSLGLTNESDLLSSGFDIVVPGKHPQTPLSQPVIQLDNSVSCQLKVVLPTVPNAKAYHVQFNVSAAVWTDLGIFPNTRKIVLPNTTPGTVYSVRVRAVGGSTQYSTWSGVVSLMST
jgi:type II secretory pathway pseudopilin PulG